MQASRLDGVLFSPSARGPWKYAQSLFLDTNATLDDLREAVTTLEELALIARRVLGGAHPVTGWIGKSLRCARAALHARETPSGNA